MAEGVRPFFNSLLMKRMPLGFGAVAPSLTAAPCAPGVSIPGAAAGPRVERP
jgi:hypothetical protein